MNDDELRTLVIAKLIEIRNIADYASEKGGLVFDVIKKIASEALDEIESY